MRVLDLFSGGGGASVGMQNAGATFIMGIDIEEQPEYPFWFMQANALELTVEYLQRFDFIWASPPCQQYSIATARWRNSGREYSDLVAPIRGLLRIARIPFVIENVYGAPMNRDLTLCGEMFGLKIIRHRIFEIFGFECEQLDHLPHRGRVCDGYYVTVAGNGGNYAGHNFDKLNDLPELTQLQTWQFAMGIDWIKDKRRLKQAVPPAYATYIFSQFLNSRKIG